MREWLGTLVGAAALLTRVAWVGGLVAGIVAGGMGRVIGWMFLVQLVPLSAPLWLLPSLAWWAWRRRRPGPWHGAVLALSALCLLPGLVGFGIVPVAYPFASLAGSTPSAEVRLPLDGEVIVGWGGDAIATNYHAADAAQRWAYDLLVDPAGHGSTSLEDYGCYGLPVLAPAAGTVTVARDGLPDQAGGTFVPNYAEPAGNHVALRIGTGTHLVLAHLQPGSVAVAVGDEVEEGQVLGRCGNSGNTSEPHVHVHHQRQDPAVVGLVAEGLPLWFRDLEGRNGPVMPTGGLEVDGERVRFVGERVRAR
ncbi:MAG: M23 family metallopeptidase [Myxococcales bacterium]|nr:M23 family metallopeptidase [Myxococcales bacterium]